MKKYILLFLTLIFSVAQVAAQQVSRASEWSDENSTMLYGLKDRSTDEWVVKPQYFDALYLGTYEGVYYYGLQNADKLWGVISSEDFTKMKVEHQYDMLNEVILRRRGIPIVIVRKGALWGVSRSIQILVQRSLKLSIPLLLVVETSPC